MKQRLSDAIEFLRSREGLFLVLVAALLVQAPHSGEVFHRISTSHWLAPLTWLHATGFAVVLELAVLLFVIRGRRWHAWTFAVFSMAMNVFYYYDSTWIQSFGDLTHAVIASLVASIVLPLAIAFYSHEVAAVADAQSAEIPTIAEQMPDIAQADAPEPDAQPLQLRIGLLRSEGLSNETIALQLSDVSGYALAKVLGIAPSTISRWRKAAQNNGHCIEQASA